MNEIEIEHAPSEPVALQPDLHVYGYTLSDFCRAMRFGRAKVMALIERGYLDATLVGSEILILSPAGREVARDLELPETLRGRKLKQ